MDDDTCRPYVAISESIMVEDLAIIQIAEAVNHPVMHSSLRLLWQELRYRSTINYNDCLSRWRK